MRNRKNRTKKKITVCLQPGSTQNLKKKEYNDQNPEETGSRIKWDIKEAPIATMIQQLCERNVAVHLQYMKGHTDIGRYCYIDQLINKTWKKNKHGMIQLNVAIPGISHKETSKRKITKK